MRLSNRVKAAATCGSASAIRSTPLITLVTAAGDDDPSQHSTGPILRNSPALAVNQPAVSKVSAMGMAPLELDAAVGGANAIDAVDLGRNAHRAAGVAAEREVGRARRHRCRRAAGRTPGDAIRRARNTPASTACMTPRVRAISTAVLTASSRLSV